MRPNQGQSKHALNAQTQPNLTCHVHQRQRVHPALVLRQAVTHRQQRAACQQLKRDGPQREHIGCGGAGSVCRGGSASVA